MAASKTGGKGRVVKMRNKSVIQKKCTLYGRKFYEDYVEDMSLPVKQRVLTPAETRAFDKHRETCLYCSRQVVKAIAEDDRAWAIIDEMEKGHIPDQPEGKRWAVRRSAVNFRQAVQEEPLALAASPPRRLDCHGVAYGVAVDLEKHQGVLLECIADVSEVPKLRSKLEIRAIERKTTKNGEKITTPTDHLENILNDLFITHEALLPLRLWEKAIRVEINCKMGSGYIVEPDSMGLAVLVAIVSAVTGRKINKDTLFSAGIKFKGYLEGVGDLEDKIQVARGHRMKSCYTADETRPINAEKSIKESGIALHYFETLDDVLRRLRLVGKAGGVKTKPEKRATTKREKR